MQDSKMPPDKIIWILVGVVALIAILIVVAAVAGGQKKQSPSASKPGSSGTPASSNGETKIDVNGTATQEASVGDDVVWTIVITNTGTSDVVNLEANTDFGGLQLVSISPQPTAQPIQMIQDFGPLKAGQNVTITYNLLAAKVGVANGLLSFYEKDKSDSNDKVLKPQTIIR